jgi:hypothetical protein
MALIGYVTTEEYEASAALRGITLTKVSSEMLWLAVDYMELQSYSGYKTDPDQVLAFPRNGDTEVPLQIKHAQMLAAGIYDQGGDPIGTVGPRVIENTVHGAVTQRFSDSGTSTPIYRKLNAALRPFLSNGGSGMQFEVTRG